MDSANTQASLLRKRSSSRLQSNDTQTAEPHQHLQQHQLRRKRKQTIKPTVQERLERQVAYYNSKWPAVPRLQPFELTKLLSGENSNSNNVLLIDVRTTAERSVSMIAGAVPLCSVLQHESIHHDRLLDPDTVIVTYCTIGYRSGMEATRLLHRHPELKHRMYNFDGIVAYTHHLASSISTVSEYEESETVVVRGLIDPVTQEPVRTVHTFGSMWSLADDSFSARHFGPAELLARLAQVGGKVTVRFVQRMVHHSRRGLRGCCPPYTVNSV